MRQRLDAIRPLVVLVFAATNKTAFPNLETSDSQKPRQTLICMNINCNLMIMFGSLSGKSGFLLVINGGYRSLASIIDFHLVAVQPDDISSLISINVAVSCLLVCDL